MLEDGVFNSEKLFFEIRQQGYTGGKTILKDYITSVDYPKLYIRLP